MTGPPRKVLLIEDNPPDARLIELMLFQDGPTPGANIQLEHVETLREGLERLEQETFDIILLDLSLPESRGLDTFEEVAAKAVGVPIVVFTGADNDELAARAMQRGAQDYLVKGQVDGNLLRRSIRYSIERGQVEQKLRARAKELAEADRRKDEFLAMLAHELRNPLAPIRTALEVLRPSLPQLEHAQDAARIIDRQLSRLTRLIDDLLDISRITYGKISLEREVLPVSSIVDGAIETCSPLLEGLGHTLSLDFLPEDLLIEGDRTRLEQVLVNLITNAAKYSEPGSEIVLSVACAERGVRLAVRDAGIGMTPETLARAFDLFAQGVQSLDRAQGGLGIGLTMVKRLVEMHGGTVEARSDGPGRGSEFTVTLPTYEGESPRDPQAESMEEPELRQRKILVVDDNQDAADSLTLLLNLWGHDVTVSYSGRDALEKARADPPDSVLLDLGLPELDGYEVARRLRRLPGLENVLVVAVSGYGQQSDRLRSREAGIDHHLVKPVDPEAIQMLLREEGSLRS